MDALMDANPSHLRQELSADDLQTMRDRHKACVAAETENRSKAQEDVRLLNGDHWPQDIRSEREAAGRPCLTLNKLPQYVDQVVGDHRQNRPGIKLRATDDAAKDKVTSVGGQDYTRAQVMEGIIRNIEYESKASIAYDTAFQHSTEHGFGSWRIVTDYEHEETFDQIIRIRPIRNAFTVYWDPNSELWDKSDAMYCFLTRRMPKSEFRERWPDATASELGQGEGDWVSDWVFEDEVRVSEYFRRVVSEYEIGLLSTGEVVRMEEVQAILDEMQAEGITVARTRKVKGYKVEWSLVTANETLEGPVELPTKFIPVVTVYGKELYVDGKTVYRGLVRNSGDAQRMYNYWRSASTELVALAPKAPYIGVVEQFEGFEGLWATANIESHGYLPYNLVEGADRPRREPMPEIPAGAVNEAMTADADIKATIGLYDPSMGNRDGNQSGRAIMALQREGDTSTFVFHDNLSRAIENTGRILLDMIPRVYDTNRVIRVRHWEETEDFVEINQTIVDEQTGQEVTINDLGVGHYDVQAHSGPSYGTQRQETQAAMMNFVQQMPDSAALIADIIAEASDWPKSDQIAARFRTALPPEIRAQEDPEFAEEQQNKEPTPEEQLAMKELETRMLEAQAKQAEAAAKEAEAEATKVEAQARMAEVASGDNEERIRQMVAASIAEWIQEQQEATSDAPSQ